VVAVQAMTSAQGVEMVVALATNELLPGRLTPGVVRLDVSRPTDARGLTVTLVGTETWQFERSEVDRNGHHRTRTVTQREELRRYPVRVHPPGTLAPGPHELPFEIPAPGLGPATLVATVARLDWTVRAKIDVPWAKDVGVELPVRIPQPIALLRAGVVRVGQFALWEGAEAETGGARVSIALDPVPLCMGQGFEGRIRLEMARPLRVQEVRLELRVIVKATVGNGKTETIMPWVARLAGDGEIPAGTHDLAFGGELPRRDLPTIELPHGRAHAELHLILARALARDPHLVRDVAICTTTEI
jgi:hypothetical protein